MNIEKIKKDYVSGLEYKKITKKHHITKNQLEYLIKKNNWKRTVNNGYKGNKNAKGNKGGPGAEKHNQRALKTGEYENIFNSVLSENEQTIYNNTQLDAKKELEREINILTIRELRILGRIQDLQDKNKDMTINSMSKIQIDSPVKIQSSTTTTTNAESTTTSIQKLEESLTRVQEAKRRCIDSYNKIQDTASKENNIQRVQIINDLPMEANQKEDEENDTTS